ncbi:MAG: protease-like activity factor CPAF [Victivallaceae bacterium]
MKKLFVSLAFCLLVSNFNGICGENKKYGVCDNSQSILFNGLQDLDFINHLVNTKYAPISWKEKIFGWSAEKELQNFRDRLSWHYYLKVSHIQEGMFKYFESLQDYHAGIHFFATERSYLPLVLKRTVNGSVFVVDALSNINGLSIGDEIIEFDGVPIRSVIAYKMKGKGGLTDLSNAVRSLTFVSKAGGASYVPSGCSSLLLRKSDGSLKNVVVSWHYTPEQVKDLLNIHTHIPTPYAVRSIFKHDQKKTQSVSQSLRTDMMPFFWQFRKHWESSFREHGLGAKLGFVPYFGHSVLWEQATGPFRAYICKVVDSAGISKNLGFIRIPTYSWEEMQDAVDEPWELFGKIVSFMQAHTDGLIIDQQNNPGGSVFYMYGLISMLIDQPVRLPLHHMTITQEEVESSVNWLETLKDVATDYQAQAVLGEHIEGLVTDIRSARAIKDFSQKIIREWEFGRYSFTNPLPLLGFDKVYPNPYYRYTKPIIMLINEECYSCGDLMPAIMKDNDRSLLIGQVTAGAGGFVYQVEFPNRSGINSCSLTGSMALRKDGSYIENVGVTPDVILNLTNFDLKSGDYKDYVQNVENLSLSWIQEHNSGMNASDPDPHFVIQ